MTVRDRMIRVHGRRLRSKDGWTRLTFEIDGLEPSQLHFEIEDAYADFVGSCYDPAAVALLVPAMHAGRRLIIEGSMSPKLLWHINHQVRPILSSLFPELVNIDVVCKGPEADGGSGQVGEAVLTGLSNGIDSLTACLDHLADDTPPALRITHLLFNDVGSHSRSKRESLLPPRLERVRETANVLGLPLIRVSSNMDEFHLLKFQKTHTLRNASVALALQGQGRRWLYASGYPYSEVQIRPAHDVAHADVVLLPLLGTERMELVSTGAQYSRVAKTARIADHPIAWGRLDVCVTQSKNCSRCWKCMRTLLTLDLLGQLDKFSEVFDLDAYRRERTRYAANVLVSRDPLLREVRRLMRQVDYRVEPTIRIRAAGLIMKKVARRVVARVPGR